MIKKAKDIDKDITFNKLFKKLVKIKLIQIVRMKRKNFRS